MPPPKTPAPFLMLSDADRLPDWQALIAAHPSAVGLVLRDYAHPKRAHLAAQMAQACRKQGRYFSVAGDARLAASVGAAFHCPSYMLARPASRHGRAAPQDSAAVHNMAELIAAQRAGFRSVLIAPVFATRSHRGRAHWGPCGLLSYCARRDKWGWPPMRWAVWAGRAGVALAALRRRRALRPLMRSTPIAHKPVQMAHRRVKPLYRLYIWQRP